MRKNSRFKRIRYTCQYGEVKGRVLLVKIGTNGEIHAVEEEQPGPKQQ